MGVYRPGLHRARGQKLTRVLLDEFVDAGVLRHISDGIGQHTVNRIGDILLEARTHLQRCSWHDSFGHFVAILRGSDDGDIRFGRDVVAHVALGTRQHTVG